jgi:hypothetical protein
MSLEEIDLFLNKTLAVILGFLMTITLIAFIISSLI